MLLETSLPHIRDIFAYMRKPLAQVALVASLTAGTACLTTMPTRPVAMHAISSIAAGPALAAHLCGEPMDYRSEAHPAGEPMDY